MAESYNLALVGSSFASTFFLQRYLELAPKTARVLVLERGERNPHSWHFENYEQLAKSSVAQIDNETPKPWAFRLAFGGCSNCWWACTPRMRPDDFDTATRFGYGTDWPLTYAELEPYYCAAEALMSVAGSQGRTPFPMSRPYPQAPHRMSQPDLILQRAHPDAIFPVPSARPTGPTAGGRPSCCGNAICHTCPIDAKFTIQNELAYVYNDPRVTLRTSANVLGVTLAGGVAKGVRYAQGGRETEVSADLVGLGANAMFNPYLLLRSGLSDAAIGRGITEQASVVAVASLDGVDNFQGGTSTTAHGYLLHGPEHRREHSAILLETLNSPWLRSTRGKQRQNFVVKVVMEDVPQPNNTVRFDPKKPDKPIVHFESHSPHTLRALAALRDKLPRALAALPIQRLEIPRAFGPTEAHMMCSTVMGRDPSTSVVDSDLVHHSVRNLLVLGASVFPTAAPANPTLTLTALSLRAADRLFARAAPAPAPAPVQGATP